MQLKSLLEKMIEVHASDVFIIAGLPLAYQASGSHVRTDTGMILRTMYRRAFYRGSAVF